MRVLYRVRPYEKIPGLQINYITVGEKKLLKMSAMEIKGKWMKI